MKYLKTYESYVITIKIDTVPDTEETPGITPITPEVFNDLKGDAIPHPEGDDLVGVVMTEDDMDILSEDPNVNVEY